MLASLDQSATMRRDGESITPYWGPTRESSSPKLTRLALTSAQYWRVDGDRPAIELLPYHFVISDEELEAAAVHAAGDLDEG